MMADPVGEFARCRPWIEAALAEDTLNGLTLADVIERIGDGRMHFWAGKKCACVTEVAVFPRKRFLNVTLAGGDMDEILGMIPSFKDWAQRLGCERLTVCGRPGWERVLRPLGWNKDLVVVSVPVEGTTGRNV